MDALHPDGVADVPSADPESRSVRWRSFPLVDDFPTSVLLVVLLAAAGIGVGVSFQSVGLGVLSAVLLSGSVARYFYPTWYELSESGVSVRSWLGEARKSWAAFARCDVHRVGVHLSPFGAPSALDPFRGTFLRFAGNGEAVVAFVRGHLPPGRTRGPVADADVPPDPDPDQEAA